MYKLDLEKTKEQRSNCQHLLDRKESKGIPEKKKKKTYFCFIDFKVNIDQTTLSAS